MFLLQLVLACTHTPKISQEDASYLAFHSCNLTVPTSLLPPELELAPVKGGWDRPAEFSPLVAVGKDGIWLDGERMDNAEQLRSHLIDRGERGAGGMTLGAGEAPGGQRVLLAIDRGLTLMEVGPVLSALRSVGRTDWELLAAHADPLPPPELPHPELGARVQAEIAATPSERSAILARELEPLAVRCGALTDALSAAQMAPAEAQCRVLLAQDYTKRCKQDAAAILTLLQIAEGSGPAVTHLRVHIAPTGTLVPLNQTALWSEAITRLAEFDGETVNPAVSAPR